MTKLEKDLRAAVESRNIKKIKSLLARKVNPAVFEENKGHVLTGVAYKGDVEAIDWLMSKGADVNEIDDIPDNTAIVYAVGKGHFAAVEALIGHGASVSWGGDKGNRLLSYAIRCGHDKIAKVLRDAQVIEYFSPIPAKGLKKKAKLSEGFKNTSKKSKKKKQAKKPKQKRKKSPTTKA